MHLRPGLALLLLREHLLGSLTDPQDQEIARAVVGTVLADLRALLRSTRPV